METCKHCGADDFCSKTPHTIVVCDNQMEILQMAVEAWAAARKAEQNYFAAHEYPTQEERDAKSEPAIYVDDFANMWDAMASEAFKLHTKLVQATGGRDFGRDGV